MSALGSRQYIIKPNPEAKTPKTILPTGNYLPSTYTSTFVASVLFLNGFKFYARSFLMTPQIGAMAEMIGTSTPMNMPPRIESEVGVI